MGVDELAAVRRPRGIPGIRRGHELHRPIVDGAAAGFSGQDAGFGVDVGIGLVFFCFVCAGFFAAEVGLDGVLRHGGVAAEHTQADGVVLATGCVDIGGGVGRNLGRIGEHQRGAQAGGQRRGAESVERHACPGQPDCAPSETRRALGVAVTAGDQLGGFDCGVVSSGTRQAGH